MLNRFVVCLALGLSALTGTISLSAQGLPSAPAVIKRYFDAIGGEALISKIQSARLKVIVISERGSGPGSGTGDMYFMRPQKYLFKSGHPPVTLSLLNACDGLRCWAAGYADRSPEPNGPLLDVLKTSATFFGIFRSPDQSSKATVTDRVPFRNTEVFKLKLPTSPSVEVFELYDVKTGLLIGTEIRGKGTEHAVFSEHRRFVGLLLPTSVATTDFNGLQLNLTINDVTFNTVMDDLFQRPSK